MFVEAWRNGDSIVAQLVERKITWAEGAKEIEAALSSLRQASASADHQWLADLNASNQAELARRQAAANVLMQWSQQQQLINAATRPVVTNCNAFGSSVNCISH